LAYVIPGSFAVPVVGQLALRHRAGVTESLAVTMTIVIGVNAFAALIVLSRLKAGTQVLDAGLLAAGFAIAAARVCDVLVPTPRLAPQVPRGATGGVVGAMLGTAGGAGGGRGWPLHSWRSGWPSASAPRRRAGGWRARRRPCGSPATCRGRWVRL